VMVVMVVEVGWRVLYDEMSSQVQCCTRAPTAEHAYSGRESKHRR
jgi:hypothetical protein